MPSTLRSLVYQRMAASRVLPCQHTSVHLLLCLVPGIQHDVLLILLALFNTTLLVCFEPSIGSAILKTVCMQAVA